MSTDPDQIRREIEATREDLSGNVNALAESVKPGNVARRQVDKVMGGASSLKDRVMGAADDSTSSVSDAAGSAVGSIKDAAGAAPAAVQRDCNRGCAHRWSCRLRRRLTVPAASAAGLVASLIPASWALDVTSSLHCPFHLEHRRATWLCQRSGRSVGTAPAGSMSAAAKATAAVGRMACAGSGGWSSPGTSDDPSTGRQLVVARVADGVRTLSVARVRPVGCFASWRGLSYRTGSGS
jgi:hypothetical protein